MIPLWIDWSTKYNQFHSILLCFVLFCFVRVYMCVYVCVCVRVFVCLLFIYIYVKCASACVCFSWIECYIYYSFRPTTKNASKSKKIHTLSIQNCGKKVPFNKELFLKNIDTNKHQRQIKLSKNKRK